MSGGQVVSTNAVVAFGYCHVKSNRVYPVSGGLHPSPPTFLSGPVRYVYLSELLVCGLADLGS